MARLQSTTKCAKAAVNSYFFDESGAWLVAHDVEEVMEAKSVFITRMIPDRGLCELTAAGLQISTNPFARGLRREELQAEMARHDAMICQLTDRIDQSVFKAGAGRCKIVANCATGVDNIDLVAAKEFNIVVTNTPGVLTESTADLTWGLILATTRRLGEAERFVRAGAWRGWGMLDFLGTDVHGKVLGIIGAGKIGQAVAKRAKGFDLQVLYYSRGRSPRIEELGAKQVNLFQLLEQSDIISLHVPLTQETHHLLNEGAFDRIKRGAILINTARGSVVDQAAMISALADGRLSGAGLDVFEKEPAVPQELMQMENVVLLPHIGSATIATRNRMAEIAAANVVAVLGGKQPLNPVAK